MSLYLEFPVDTYSSVGTSGSIGYFKLHGVILKLKYVCKFVRCICFGTMLRSPFAAATCAI